MSVALKAMGLKHELLLTFLHFRMRLLVELGLPSQRQTPSKPDWQGMMRMFARQTGQPLCQLQREGDCAPSAEIDVQRQLLHRCGQIVSARLP